MSYLKKKNNQKHKHAIIFTTQNTEAIAKEHGYCYGTYSISAYSKTCPKRNLDTKKSGI